MSNARIRENGVMLNAYPDSIGSRLADAIELLKLPEFKDVFSLFYVLPTFFHSDLDRGFSIIDYDLNEELVDAKDLEELEVLGVKLKFDIVLNHLSVASPQFRDLLENGDDSEFIDFFIDWNKFWAGSGEKDKEGVLVPRVEFLSKLFMRKPGLPVLKVPFPDGSERPYWNTFYQSRQYNAMLPSDFTALGMDRLNAERICAEINHEIRNGALSAKHSEGVLAVVNKKMSLLGQMDVNAKSEKVWAFYDEVLAKVSSYGCKILRLDAFAYLHKEVGQSNFFNKPGTWEHLQRINGFAKKYDLQLLPEIHAEYGLHLHDEVANEGYQIYDFFLPGLLIHTIETASIEALFNWGREIVSKGYQTINMLGCHDGIPVLDLKGRDVNGRYLNGLLSDEEIDNVMEVVLSRGGRVKNLYGPDGRKISYYQVNATYYSALGEDDSKLLLARAIQVFFPGIPQVWYLDLFKGKNDYAAADKAGKGGHKEINRTNLGLTFIRALLNDPTVLNQLELLRIRNTSQAFEGGVEFHEMEDGGFEIIWTYDSEFASLKGNLNTLKFEVRYSQEKGETIMRF